MKDLELITIDENDDNDPRTRKWQITINNPVDKGYTHDVIVEKLQELDLRYYCLSDEIGLENSTFHTHIFLFRDNDIRFSRLLKLFKGGHFDYCKGTCAQNRDYIFKEGKWLDDPKADTNLRDSHIEWGEMPLERVGKRNDLDDLYDLIRQGLSDVQILNLEPSFMIHFDKFEKIRQSILREKYSNVWRELEVTYIYGSTGTGKTRGIMEKYGYINVYRISDYLHPFDDYKGQDVIIFEEFRSDIKIGNMLKYLEGYPLDLPCRYSNKTACFTKIFIISNIPLYMQYPNLRKEENATYNAFIRRISKVIRYTSNGFYECSVQEALEVAHLEDASEQVFGLTHEQLVENNKPYYEQMKHKFG